MNVDRKFLKKKHFEMSHSLRRGISVKRESPGYDAVGGTL